MDFKTEYLDIWMMAWNFHKKYASAERVNWENAVNESAKLLEQRRGKSHETLLKALLIAVIKEMEKIEANAK